MANTKFDSKSFNPEAFKYMVERIPNLKLNELKKSRALAGNADIKGVFNSQNGTSYARLAMRGLADGDAVNYDGQTDIVATSTKTFEQGVVVVGRAKAWTELDFAQDITGGEDFMANISAQVAEYKDALDQDTILAALEGVFAMTGDKNLEFVNAHTTDVTLTDSGVVTATTLNSAANKACGAHKKNFTLVFMHSDVTTNLENLKLLEYLTYTDADGITRDLALSSWNGKLVVTDDDMPTEVVVSDAALTEDTALNASKTYYTREGTAVSGYTYTEVTSPVVGSIGTYYEATEFATDYTTYVLGNGAISYEDIGAKVVYEMDRDPKVNGGEDTLYMRQRKCFAPYGISYEKTSQASLSPTDAELKNGANWALVHSGESTEASRSYINHKAIPIARILSRG